MVVVSDNDDKADDDSVKDYDGESLDPESCTIDSNVNP